MAAPSPKFSRAWYALGALLGMGACDAGGFYADSNPPPVSDKTVSHSGDYSAEVVIDTSSGADQISRLYRRIGQKEAYYSAWFYLKEDHTPSVWWSVFLFRAVKDRNKSIDLWSVDLVRTPSNTLTVALFDHQYDSAKGRTIDVMPQPLIKVGVWFQIQAYLQQEDGMPSHVMLWIDGQEVLDLPGATLAPHLQALYWVVGNGGSKMTPPKSTVYIDDAEISSSFLKP